MPEPLSRLETFAAHALPAAIYIVESAVESLGRTADQQRTLAARLAFSYAQAMEAEANRRANNA